MKSTQQYTPRDGRGLIDPEPEFTDPTPDPWDLEPYTRIVAKDFCLQPDDEGLCGDR